MSGAQKRNLLSGLARPSILHPPFPHRPAKPPRQTLTSYHHPISESSPQDVTRVEKKKMEEEEEEEEERESLQTNIQTNKQTNWNENEGNG